MIKVNKEDFYGSLPKGWKSKSMMGDPPHVVYYTGDWDGEFTKVGLYESDYHPGDGGYYLTQNK